MIKHIKIYKKQPDLYFKQKIYWVYNSYLLEEENCWDGDI